MTVTIFGGLAGLDWTGTIGTSRGFAAALGGTFGIAALLRLDRDGRFVSVGPLALFSTDTGDAWLLDPSERLATRLALVFDIVDVALINKTSRAEADRCGFRFGEPKAGVKMAINAQPLEKVKLG